MSLNQSRANKNESHYSKTGRPAYSAQQRGSSGRGGKGGGSTGLPPSPSSSSNTQSSSFSTNRSSFKKSNGQGAQSWVIAASANSDSNATVSRAAQNAVQNSARAESPLLDFPVSDVTIKKSSDLSSQNSNRAVPRAPSSQSTSGTSDSKASTSTTHGDASVSFSLQFGSFVKGMQAQHESFRSGPMVPISSIPREQQPRKDVQQYNSRESHPPTQPKRDMHIQVPAVVGFRPGQGGNNGVLRNLHGQAPGQYLSGILSGPLFPLGSQGGIQRNGSDADRWQCAADIHRGLIPSPQSPLQVLHKATQKYELRKVTDKEEAKQRQLKAILNKLTPQNFDKLFEKVKEVNIDSAVTLYGVVFQIFDRALMEPIFCEMYAKFCNHLAEELPDFTEDIERITFKRLLLNKCQEKFERGEREQAEANRVEEDGEVRQSKEEREEKKIQARKRMLGNIRLIGELYKMKMLPEIIMHLCIKKLLGQHQNPDEEDIEALCKLMSTIGEMIDQPRAKKPMDAYFDTMSNLSNTTKLSSRLRFMLKDSIDLRKNKWQQRRKVEGPKMIEEVHRDAAQERQAQASRLARGPGNNLSARRGPTLDFSPRGSTMFSSPNTQTGAFRGFPSQGRGFGTQDVRWEERQTHENRTLSVPLPHRPTDDDSITLGPQGGLARGLSVRGQPMLSSTPVADRSIFPGDSRRMTAGPNGFSSVSELTHYNSREEHISRYAQERLMGQPALDQSKTQEHSMYGNRNLRNANYSLDTSMTGPSSTQAQAISAVIQNVPSEPVWPEEHLRNKSIAAIREFYSAKDENEVASCIKDLNSPSFHPSMISIWVTDSFERKDRDRDILAGLLVSLSKSRDGLLTQAQLIKGVESVLASLEDAVTDAPKAAEFLGHILGKVIAENVVSLREIGQLIHEGGEEPGRLLQIGLGYEVFKSTSETIRSEKGESFLTEISTSSNSRLEDFRPPDPT